MGRLWYRYWHWLCTRIYFGRVEVLWRERLPERGPVLYIVLHRNGAVDGFVYGQAIPRGVFLVSTQLLRGLIARLFFHGIAVTRKQDEGDASRNEAALARCVELLGEGGEMTVFPEGTSSLGPRHLPFKSGAASLAVDAIGRGIPLKIVPLGIHYQCAWEFRSRVEIVVGEELATDLAAGLSDLGKLKEMKRRMNVALEGVGANFSSPADQEAAEGLAGLAALAGGGYFPALKAMEPVVPEPLAARWRGLLSGGARPYQGVPLFSDVPWIFQFLQLAVLGPLVVAGALVNFVPLAAGWMAARRFADDLNTIALWRILVGMPLFALWSSGVVAATVFSGNWLWTAGYCVLTWITLKGYDRTKRLAASVWNGLAHRGLAPQVRKLQQDFMNHPPVQ